LTKARTAGKIIACVIWVMHFGDHAKPNVLNKRGAICFSSFLNYIAVWIASVQYLVFLVLLKAFPTNLALWEEYASVINVEEDEEHAGDFVLQLQFVGVVLLIETIVYILTNIVSKHYVQVMSPHYVGRCHFREFPRFKASIIFIGAHIVSDVYLGILLTKQKSRDPLLGEE
jgi:hypothetical protein